MKKADILKIFDPRCRTCTWMAEDEEIEVNNQDKFVIKQKAVGFVCHLNPNPMILIHNIDQHWCSGYLNKNSGKSLRDLIIDKNLGKSVDTKLGDLLYRVQKVKES